MKQVMTALLGMTLLMAAAPPTAEQDRQRLLDALKITALRPPPPAANTDEAKAGPTPPLPDPLVLKDGKPVTSRDMWWQQRRGEITDAYESEVYGQLPAGAPVPHWKVLDSAPETVGKQAAVTRHIGADLGGKPGDTPVSLRLTISLPANAKGPVPVILQLAGAKPAAPSTWREQVLARGWGAATLDVTSVQPDSAEGLVDGVIGLTTKPRLPQDWGVLRAWAWGASRAMDYFETDNRIDSGHVGIMGHSRYGKAALIAMAYDPRYAVAFISSSGAGGAAPFRRDFGERIENLASTGEYYWFDGNFLQYAGPKTPADLPVDSDLLLALCAPRAVFVGAGANGDSWVDPHGMFLAEAAATPVYKLLGKTGLAATAMPPAGQAADGGELAFRQHAQGHTPEPNWPAFLTFAQRYLAPPAKAKK